MASSSRVITTTPVSRPPLEQLIYSLVPSLAPVRGTRTDDLKEKERRENVAEMMKWCQEILDRSVVSRRHRPVIRADILYSNLPSSTPLSAETLPETVKRMIYASASSGAKEGGAEKALKFNSIWNKLERGVSLGATHDYRSNSIIRLPEITVITQSSSGILSGSFPYQPEQCPQVGCCWNF